MLLATAMELGFAIVTFDPGNWLTPDGSCGCPFGGAIMAAGMKDDFISTLDRLTVRPLDNWAPDIAEIQCVKKAWPWITEQHIRVISEMAFDVKKHMRTKEDILAYVRSVEPAEAPDAEQLAQEEEMAMEEGAAIEASGYPDPANDVRFA
jgi:hypothetical protein